MSHDGTTSPRSQRHPWWRGLLAATLAALVAAAGCSGGDDEPREDDAAPERDFGEVAETIDAYVEEEGLNGAGFVVVHRDEGIVFEHYAGVFGPNRVSLVASSSKMITAGVLMRLHDQGVLDVDAPVADVVDWGAEHPDIAPVHLISNSSGLVGLSDEPAYRPYLCQYLHAGTMQDCAEQIFTTPEDDEDVVPPDTRFRYGGGQWQVAGAVAEIASGKSWDELIEETYVEPCGVDSLGYNNHYTVLVGEGGPFAHPTQFDGDPSVIDPTENPNMEGGAYISPSDYAELLLMHLRGGRCGEVQVLSPESVDRMHRDRVKDAYGGDTGRGGPSGESAGYGLGWWVAADDPSHIQDGGSFGSVPWLDLEDGYGAYLVIEATSPQGQRLAEQLRPLVDELMAPAG
ncbi:MAG TPA: serine hydrolase [Microthrixaceae bacterium]|nr:serine hydrolase [Microthrixaceae bacterium]